MQPTQSAESRIEEIMYQPANVIELGETARTVQRRLSGENVRSLIVLDGGRPVGIISQRNILGADDDQPVSGLMRERFPILRPEMTLQEAMEINAAQSDEDADYDRVPVVDGNGQLVGEVMREALYHVKTVSPEEQQAAMAGSPIQPDMDVVSADDDKLGSVDDLVFDGSDLDSFTVKHGFLGRKHKRLQADLVSRVEDDKVIVKIGKMEFNMLADLEDMEAEA